jgi:dihydrofolate reductase
MTGTTRSPRRGGERRVVVSEFVTLDGYMVGPDEDMSWVADGFDPQMQEDLAVEISTTYDLFVLGRVTYDIFAAYWPHAVPYDEGDPTAPAEGKEDGRIVRALNDLPRLVFSTTLGEPAWAGTQVLRGGLEDEIRRLRKEPGQAIGIQGSASIVHALARADLVDEYHLYQHPVLLGSGKPLFPDGPGRQDLDLTNLTRYDNGVVAMTYQRKDGDAR